MTRTAAIYARVSSERQKEDHTIASQTAALRAYASEQGLEIPPDLVFEDDGFSGATLVRPALERLRDLAAEVGVDVVLCYSPDRLARKYAYQALLIEEFARVGTELRFIKGPKADTPEDELLLQFQGMIAEYERAQIAERSRRGKAHRAKTGSVSVLSGAPYGYRYMRKTQEVGAAYEINEEQAAVVRQVFRRYTEEPVSIGALTKWLSEQGFPTAKGKALWDRSTVWAILRNPAYRGRAAFLKTAQSSDRPKVNRTARLRGAKAKSRPVKRDRPPEDWIEIAVPPIVSEQQFELAARRLQDNKRFSSRRTKDPSLLQGMLVCKSCGYAYYRTSTKTSARKLYYYRCLGSDAWRYEHGRKCDSPPIRQDYLDAVVWDHVANLLSNPELVSRELDRRLAELRSASPATAQKARVDLELSRVTSAMGRLVEAYQDGLLTLDELRGRMPDLRKKEARLRADLDAIEGHLLDQETYLTLANSLGSFLDKLNGATADSTIGERQRVLRLLVKEVLVDQHQVVIRHSIAPSVPRTPAPGYLLRGGSHQPFDRQHLPPSRIRRLDE